MTTRRQALMRGAFCLGAVGAFAPLSETAKASLASNARVSGGLVANDETSVQAAMDKFGFFGGTLDLPQAVYRTLPLVMKTPVSIRGAGGSYTALAPVDVAAGADTLTISPSLGASHELQRIEGVALHEPSTGLRTGRHGLSLQTIETGQLLPKFTVRDVVIGQGAGHAIYHFHRLGAGVEGGLYAAEIENNILKGGVRLDNSGDSIKISNNVITGNYVGVHVNLIKGASLLVVEANNITANAGAVRITSGHRFRVVGNNIENSSPGAAARNQGAVVAIVAESEPIVGGTISQNLISAFGDSDAEVLLRLRGSRGASIRDNVFLAGSKGLTAIDIGPDCQDVRVGANTFNGAISVRVQDRGVGTRGVVKTAELMGAWSAAAQGEHLRFIKAESGLVTMWGRCKNEGAGPDALLTILPIGFRPSASVTAAAFAADSPKPIEISMDPYGEVRLAASGSAMVTINLAFEAKDLEDFLSPE